ncbi:hypothetical protein [Deinococcus sp. 6GRE01]|uniref:DUF6848 family protein n=1 Tax=Deinococcus sp. 6GRE01 TaxID=2745873 RepID=UPI001E514218|nr:hypothetical protein [Deinococcus sp. 6GRE01]MCD0156011.1 hypothetical protein [Deinococcus sp. 6GRE01]
MNDAPKINTPERTHAGITASRMNELRAEYGEHSVKALTAPMPGGAVQVIVRAPTRAEYDRYQETLLKIRDNKVAQALAANRRLVIDCLLAPAATDLAPALDRYPALADKLAEPILQMAGAEAEVREETF